MVEPGPKDQPTLLMIDRTLKNLDFINTRKRDPDVFEVTQLVNSFASVVGQPWDRLLDEGKLLDLSLTDHRWRSCRFPSLELHETSTRIPTANLKIDIVNADNYLRFIRNSMAHGNFEILNLRELRRYRQTGTLPSVKEREIAGLLLWNCPNNSDVPNRETSLSVFELHSILKAMKKLCMKRDLWIESVREELEHRERESRKRAS